MDLVTLSKQNRLYWLGRYAAFCGRLGVGCAFSSAEDFFRGVLFDGQTAGSARSSVKAILGNGMVLRETITSPTLAYLQMALGMAETSEAPLMELQWVLDDIMAFRGSFDDAVEAETARSITKAGGLVERTSLMLLERLRADCTGRVFFTRRSLLIDGHEVAFRILPDSAQPDE